MDDAKISGKILKLIVFFAFLGFLIWHNYHSLGVLKLADVTTALTIASLAYLALTVYSSLVRACGNYLLGLIFLAIVAVLAGKGLSKIEKLGWLNDDQTFYIAVAIGAALVLWDFILIVRQLKPNKQAINADIPIQYTVDSHGLHEMPKLSLSGPEALPLAAQQLREKFGRDLSMEELLQHIEFIDETYFTDQKKNR